MTSERKPPEVWVTLGGVPVTVQQVNAWNCPHGCGHVMLVDTVAHIDRVHSDCWSCTLEQMLVRALRQAQERSRATHVT